MVYDCAIIGTGPAGLSAALNLKIHGKNVLWLGDQNICSKVEKAEKVMNYPGLPAVSGPELASAFRRQAEEMGLAVTDRMVNSILSMGDRYALMAGSEFYEAKTLLLATGVTQVGCIPGEQALLGKGVSYCATCDGMLYRGKTIAIVITDPRFEHEANYLAGLAEKVLLFAQYKDCNVDLSNVTIMGGVLAAIEGEKRAEAVRRFDGAVYPVDGVFCLRSSIELTTLLPGLALEAGHITVDREQKTNLSGVFAAGDCTGRPYQYTKAVGEGNVAAHSIVKYLAKGDK